jgi:hypothetical protein
VAPSDVRVATLPVRADGPSPDKGGGVPVSRGVLLDDPMDDSLIGHLSLPLVEQIDGQPQTAEPFCRLR